MFEIVYEENKYFAIENNYKVIYTYPSNIKNEDMDISKQYLYRLKYGLVNTEELSSIFLKIDSNKPLLQSLHSIDGDHISFQILKQNNFIRGSFLLPIFIGKERYEKISVESVACPDVSFNNIYLRGTSTDRDRVKIFKKINPIQAKIVMKILDDLNTKSVHQVFLDSLSGMYKKL